MSTDDIASIEIDAAEFERQARRVTRDSKLNTPP